MQRLTLSVDGCHWCFWDITEENKKEISKEAQDEFDKTSNERPKNQVELLFSETTVIKSNQI